MLATVSDKKLGRVLDSTGVFAAYYDGQVRSVQDYYAFGWNIPSRKFNSDSYRFGFNNQEKQLIKYIPSPLIGRLSHFSQIFKKILFTIIGPI